MVFSKKALPFWLGGVLVVFAGFLILRKNVSTLRVDRESISESQVFEGEFADYVRVTGNVQPMTTIQVSSLESGVVEEILIEEGAALKAGDKILRLSNEGLDLQILNAEADLAEKENLLRNTMISMEQQRLSVRQDILQLNMEVKRNERAYRSQEALYRDSLIAREDYLRAKEDYDLSAGRLELMKERNVQDSLYRSVQIEQMEESLSNMRINMQMIRQRKDNLIVKAPIDGELGLLDVVLGQSIPSGMKLGQINNLDQYKIEAQIDEHYIDRVSAGLEAQIDRQDETYETVIRKVYPEVREGKFKADFKFTGEVPEHIRTGQTYYLNLQLGQPAQAVLIAKGTFYQYTGGKWIYVISSDGSKALRREIRIGRQNPQYYEVLEGLEPGEKVIVTGYDRFGDNECLVLKSF